MKGNLLKYLEENSSTLGVIDAGYTKGLEQFEVDYNLEKFTYGVEDFKSTLNSIIEAISKFFEKIKNFFLDIINSVRAKIIGKELTGAAKELHELLNSNQKNQVKESLDKSFREIKIKGAIDKNQIKEFANDISSLIDDSDKAKDELKVLVEKFPDFDTTQVNGEFICNSSNIISCAKKITDIKHKYENAIKKDEESTLDNKGFDGTVDELSAISNFYDKFYSVYKSKYEKIEIPRFKAVTDQYKYESDPKTKDKLTAYVGSFSLVKKCFIFIVDASTSIIKTIESYLKVVKSVIKKFTSKEEDNGSSDKKGNESFLSELYSTQLENTHVQFRTDTDLGHICQAVSSAISLSTPYKQDEEELTSTLIQNIDKFFETDQGNRYLTEIQEYSKLFSEKLNDAFDELRMKVSPEVNELTKSIINKSEEYLTRATSLSNINGNMSTVLPEFTYVDLDKYKSEQVIIYANELVKKYLKGNVKSVDTSTLRYIADKINNITDIPVSKGDLQDWATDIAIYLTKSEDPKDNVVSGIANSLRLAFSSIAFNDAKSSIFNRDLNTGKFSDMVIKYANGFIKLNEIFKRLDIVADITNEEDMKAFKANIETLSDFYKLNAVLLGLASERYENSLIIGPTMINKKKYDEFISQGGSDKDIANFIRYNYNHDKEDAIYKSVAHNEFPSFGVSMNTVIENKEFVNNKISSLIDKLTLEYKSLKNSCVKKAYEDTLREYVADIESNHPEMVVDTHRFGIDCRRMIPHLSANLVRFETENIYDAVYEFYLRTWYSDSLVSNIYYKLGSVIINDLTSSDLNENTLKYAHFTVMSDILSEYITKTMIEPIKY